MASDRVLQSNVLLLFGTRASEQILCIVRYVCGHCGVLAQQTVVKQVNRFTLFFISLFPVGTTHYVECANCGSMTPLSREQAERSVQWASANPTLSA